MVSGRRERGRAARSTGHQLASGTPATTLSLGTHSTTHARARAVCSARAPSRAAHTPGERPHRPGPGSPCATTARPAAPQAIADLNWKPEFSLLDGLRDSYEKDFGRGTFRKAANFAPDDLVLEKLGRRAYATSGARW